MRIGIFADTHDHLDNIRLAVSFFNHANCSHVLFAGDLVSTMSAPPLRGLKCPVTACYGDNEGNKLGLQAGFTTLGSIGEPPVAYCSEDGMRFVLVHMIGSLKSYEDPFDIAVYGHTHRPKVHQDVRGRWFVNPGEASGWTFGRPTVALLETNPISVEIIDLEERK